MKIIFGTTSKRKIEDLQSIINSLKSDIGWDRGEIEEDSNTLEGNSLIKANSILSFCKEKNIMYPIITDDSGLFCEALNGEPGIHTARYGDDELALNPELPNHQCVIKLLRNLDGVRKRNASFKCCVTYMMPDGTFFQELGESKGYIAESIIGELKKPYFYSIFILEGYDRAFSDLSENELNESYRYIALRKTLVKMNK